MTKSERTVADRLRRFKKDELIEMLVELDRRGGYTTVDRVLTDREIAKSEACNARAEELIQNSIACLQAYKHALYGGNEPTTGSTDKEVHPCK